MSRAREVSKIVLTAVTNEELSSALENVTVDLSGYLTISSASSTYATNESLSAIDVDNLPDDLMTMGG
jgi:hypothetical protein